MVSVFENGAVSPQFFLCVTGHWRGVAVAMSGVGQVLAVHNISGRLSSAVYDGPSVFCLQREL